MRPFLLWSAVAFLAIASPLAGRAAYLEVSVWRPEMAGVVGALLIVSVAFGAVLARAGRLLRLTLVSLLVLVSLDLQLGSRTLISEIAPALGYEGMVTGTAKAAVLAVVFAGLFGLAWLLQRHLALVLLAYFGASTAMTLAVLPGIDAVGASAATGSEAAADDPGVMAPAPPLLLHIMVDGLTSPAALPADLPGAEPARRSIERFVQDFRFKSYRQVYSRYNSSFFSLGSAFNFVTSGLDLPGILEKRVVEGQVRYTLNQNRYFDRLAERGYRIHVYQYEIFDFCGHPAVERCRTQSIYDPLDESVRAAMDRRTRLANLALDLAGPDSFVHRIATRVIRRFDPTLHVFEYYSSHSALPLLDRVAEDAIEASDGTAIFFHLMAPHAPFIWDEDCRLADSDPALHKEAGAGNAYGEGQANDPATRRGRYQRYFAQTRCVVDGLASLMQRLEAADRLDRTMVLVHGDHGSRIALADRKGHPDKLSERDLVDLHAAFFAVRRPGQAPGRDTTMVSLQAMFARLFDGAPAQGGEPAGPPTVVIESRAADPDGLEIPMAELPMPEFVTR